MHRAVAITSCKDRETYLKKNYGFVVGEIKNTRIKGNRRSNFSRAPPTQSRSLKWNKRHLNSISSHSATSEQVKSFIVLTTRKSWSIDTPPTILHIAGGNKKNVLNEDEKVKKAAK